MLSLGTQEQSSLIPDSMPVHSPKIKGSTEKDKFTGLFICDITKISATHPGAKRAKKDHEHEDTMFWLLSSEQNK